MNEGFGVIFYCEIDICTSVLFISRLRIRERRSIVLIIALLFCPCTRKLPVDAPVRSINIIKYCFFVIKYGSIHIYSKTSAIIMKWHRRFIREHAYDLLITGIRSHFDSIQVQYQYIYYIGFKQVRTSTSTESTYFNRPFIILKQSCRNE